MKVRFTPEAQEQAEAMDTWWRQHREDARDLFARELAETKALLLSSPKVGAAYVVLNEQIVRRVPIPRTRNHVYYTYDADEGDLLIHAVWGAPKGRGPKLVSARKRT